MIRKEIFEKINGRIKDAVRPVRHVALWNENVAFADMDEPFERPAVFVEFGTVEWACGTLGSGLHVVFSGDCVVRIHVVTDYSDSGDEGGFAVCSQVRDALTGLQDERWGPLVLWRTLTNHNHEELLESIEEFRLKLRYIKAL